jgi:hypothetical protein
VWILGFELTFPSPPSSTGEEPQEPWGIVKIGCEAAARHDLSSGATTLLPPWEQPAPAGELVFVGASAHPQRPQLLAAPLCDTARFERSGVQLI